MGLPGFMLRKLYQKGSLRQVDDSHFTFRIQNPLANATIVAPPELTVNGIHYKAHDVQADVDFASVSLQAPLEFRKGDTMDITLPGRLLRAGNRIHLLALTKQWGELDILVEDKEADYCGVGDDEE